MDIRLIYREAPDASCCAALDRKLRHIASAQEAIDGGKRLWLSRVPDAMCRPLANPRPFDVIVSAARLSDDEAEAFRLGLGAIPKRRMICRCYEKPSEIGTDSESAQQREENTAIDILFAIAFEIMTTTSALLCITGDLMHRMQGNSPLQMPDDDAHWKSEIYRYPGQISEIALEIGDGDLSVMWIVDARWLRAWTDERNRRRGLCAGEKMSRFATLDYF